MSHNVSSRIRSAAQALMTDVSLRNNPHSDSQAASSHRQNDVQEHHVAYLQSQKASPTHSTASVMSACCLRLISLVAAATGLARAAFHGVPRVLLSRPAEHLQSGAYSPAFTDAEGSSSCPAISDSAGGGAEDDTMLDTALAEFISKARINVSIRQVVSDGPDAART